VSVVNIELLHGTIFMSHIDERIPPGLKFYHFNMPRNYLVEYYNFENHNVYKSCSMSILVAVHCVAQGWIPHYIVEHAISGYMLQFLRHLREHCAAISS